MTKTGKIKAFTLSEMLVVLLITVIVVGLAFSVLALVQRNMHSIASNFEVNTSKNLLKQALWQDFSRHGTLVFDEPSMTLHCENELSAVQYRFQADYIVRERDTFFLKTKPPVFYFDNRVQPKGVIDALALMLREKTNDSLFFVFQEPDAAKYMNLWGLD